MAIREEQKKRGRLAEKEVQDILDQLPKSKYAVFHDIQARYGNIDHLVISREGAVFLIETKGHRGRITIHDKKILLNKTPMTRDPIAQMSRNVQWLRDLIKEKFGISAWIVSILVFTNAPIYSEKSRRVLRLRPVHKMNVISKGYLQTLIESYYPKNTRRKIWSKRNSLFKYTLDI